VQTFCGKGEGEGSSERMSALNDAKNFGFFEIYNGSVRQRGGGRVSQFEQGEGSIFCDFVRPLLTAPYHIVLIKNSNIKIS